MERHPEGLQVQDACAQCFVQVLIGFIDERRQEVQTYLRPDDVQLSVRFELAAPRCASTVRQMGSCDYQFTSSNECADQQLKQAALPHILAALCIDIVCT